MTTPDAKGLLRPAKTQQAACQCVRHSWRAKNALFPRRDAGVEAICVEKPQQRREQPALRKQRQSRVQLTGSAPEPRASGRRDFGRARSRVARGEQCRRA